MAEPNYYKYIREYIDKNPDSTMAYADIVSYINTNYPDVKVTADDIKTAFNTSEIYDYAVSKRNNLTSAGEKFDPAEGKSKNIKVPEYTGYTLRGHHMNTLLDDEVIELINATNRKGSPLTREEVLAIAGDKNATDNKYAYYLAILDDNASKFGFYSSGKTYIAPGHVSDEEYNQMTEEEKKEYDQFIKQESEQEEQDAREAAYNAYWNELYSLQDGTLGSQMLDNFTTAEQHAAMSNMQLAEAQYQQAAMDQAAVVKSITDQVKAERMAKLRAGMNEAQIANQDMQLMINNMNTLNTQMNTMNQNRLAAQQQYNLAQDTAYQQYLETAAGLGQVGAAYAASDAGDVYMQTLKRKRQTGENFATAQTYVQGLKEGTK